MIGRTYAESLDRTFRDLEPEPIETCPEPVYLDRLDLGSNMPEGHTATCRCGASIAPTGPRVRVERCVWNAVDGVTYYAEGWLVIYGEGGSDWCHHDDWETAMLCATDRARARALGLICR